MLQRSVGLVLIALALSGSSAFVGSCKTRGFQTSSIEKSSDAGAMARWLKAQDSLVPVQETMQSGDPSSKRFQFYAKALKGYEPTNKMQGVAGIRDIRPELVALSQQDGTRDLLEASIIDEQRFRSERLKTTIFSNPGTRYDTIIIGAGPHSAALVQQFTDLDPDRRVLVVDAASRPGGTFADVGPVFALNSTNRQDTGTQADVGTAQAGGPKGVGNLNAIANLIGIPDFSGLRWPLAGDLGYVTTLAMEYSSAQLLLNTRATAVGSRDSRAFVRVQSNDEQGRQREAEIEANEVILATGIGRPTFFLPRLESLKKEIADSNKKEDSNEEYTPPSIMGFGEFVSRVNQDLRMGRNPMSPYVEKKILVVGAGDSGKVVVEWLSGLGPDSTSYGPAQIGEPKNVVWSGVDFLTCQEFLATARSRYSRISSTLNSALVSLAPVKITNVARFSGTKITVTGFELKTKKDKSFGPSNLSAEDRKAIDGFVQQRTFFTTKGITAGDLKNKDQTNSDGSVNLKFEKVFDPEFDFIIDATGFRTDTLKLLQAGFGKGIFPDGTQLSDVFLPRTARLGEDANEMLRNKTAKIVGRLVVGEGDSPFAPIYTVGPANEQIFEKGLVSPEELAGVSANSVSLFANIIRTKAAAKAILDYSPRQNLSQPNLSRGTDASNKPRVTLASGSQVKREISLDLGKTAKGKGTYTEFPANDDLEVRLRKIFASVNLEGDLDNFKIWIFLDQREQQASADQKRVTLWFEPGFGDDESRNVLIQAFNADEPFKDLLIKLFPPDPVAESGRNLRPTFGLSSNKIIVVDEWVAGAAGQSSAKIRVRSDGTTKDLFKATRIDLTKSMGTAKAKVANNTLINILTQRSPLPVGCLLFKELSNGGFTILKTADFRVLTLTLFPSGLDATTESNQVNAVVNSYIPSYPEFPRNYDLELIIDYTRRRIQTLTLPTMFSYSSSQIGFSLPAVMEGKTLDFGGVFVNQAGYGFSPESSFPKLPKFLDTDAPEQLANIISVRPSDNPNVLLLNVDGEDFTSVCTTDF